MRLSIPLLSIALSCALAGQAVADAAAPTPARAPLSIPKAPPGSWSGKQGNVSTALRGGWGTGQHVYAISMNKIYHSSDRGLAWEEQELKIEGMAVWGSSPNDVWAAGLKLAHSTDQGKTFTIASPFAKGVVIYGLWGATPTELYAVGGGKGGVIYYSKNGGKKFTKQSSGTTGGWLHAVVGNGKDVFVAGSEKQKQGTRAVLLVTKDQGKRWSRLPIAALGENEDALHGICFTSSGKMFVTSTYSVLASNDRGRTWEKVHSTNQVELLGLACSDKEVFVSGRNRTFLSSQDEGKTWNDQTLQKLFTGKAFASVETVFVTGDGDVFAGGEGEYTDHSGSLFRRGK
jgi:photosystem II stability/assembly factor-like uncharacterized protein